MPENNWNLDSKPAVSVVIPARNEAIDIEMCLRAILAQDFPLSLIEVIVVDGNSTDGTVEVATDLLKQSGVAAWRIHVNENGQTPSNLNIGLHLAQSSILCRVDARSLIPVDYISTCVELLHQRSDIAVVGGSQIARATNPHFVAQGIARALNNRWWMGLSKYRRMSQSGASDTVYLGAFRTEQLQAVGGWNEKLSTNQDFDLNQRMSEFGLIWYAHSLRVGYIPRSSIAQLARQYFRFGTWKVRYWTLARQHPRPRQWLLMTGPLVATLGYLTALVRSRNLGRLILCAIGLGGLAAIDELGSDRENTKSLAVRTTSCLSLLTIAGSWLGGIYSAFLIRIFKAP